MKKPIAIIIPWFSESLKGGAEQQAWQIATRLATRGHSVEVFTTCCRSFLDDWAENHLPSGVTHQLNFIIRRFPLTKRDRHIFDDLNRELLERPLSSFLPGVSPVELKRAAIWTQHNINSTALEHYLSQHKNDYQAFIFLPYLYGVVLRGLPLVADRAWLQPCLHDEAYAYLPDVADIFYRAKGLLFISPGEMHLAARLYGPMVFAKGAVAGAGIELEGLRTDHYLDLPEKLAGRRFLLCLGRRDVLKGVDRLVAAFRAFRESRPSSDLYLALAGPGEGCYTDTDQGVIDLGLVSEAEKAALLQSCLALCQPSANESFSRVLFEAWACGKPVIAHRDCLATAMAVQASGGGWTAGSEAEWVARIADIDTGNSGAMAAIGAKGRDYAREMADWDRVMVRYESLLGLKAETQSFSLPVRKTKAIHQLLPNLSYGDAISNEAIWIRDGLRKSGYRSEIFALYIDRRVIHHCRHYKDGAITPTDGLLYHHSIGSEITPAAVVHPGPKCLIYHNITPAEFFQSYRPEFARLLRHGREELWTLARSFPMSVGDSAYNAEELALHGFTSPGVLPLAIDPGKWDAPPDTVLMHQLQDGKRNLLFVGRYAPNKCQHQLVEAFAHYLALDPDARLILVGSGEPHDPYVRLLQQIIDHYRLRERVIMPGHITDAQLQAYYRTAHLFWSVSEHEGFCVPLIEAMWFDIPILAYSSSAIPETLGGAGVVLTDKTDLRTMAATAKILADHAELRTQVLNAQRRRREAFLPWRIQSVLEKVIHQMEENLAVSLPVIGARQTEPDSVILPLPTVKERPHVCFIVQRYGEEVNGGAELLCRLIAERMTAYWDVEVLTSCARDYVKRFENDYPAGASFLNGVLVRRFNIDHLRSDDLSFSTLDRKVVGRQASALEEQEWLREIGPYCEGLMNYLNEHRDDFTLVFFMTYLYATTTLALPLVKEKAVLVPNAHDEAPMRATFFDHFFNLPRALVLHTPEEMEFLQARTRGLMATPHLIGGVGFDIPSNREAHSFREQFGITGSYLLYVGRIQPEKGCDVLFEYYLALPKSFRQRFPLVLIGKNAMNIPDDPTIMAVGYIDDSLKISAMTGATLLIMPSPHESLNMAILESWLCETPVLVNGHCEVLKKQCQRSHGGLWFENQNEFNRLLYLLTDDHQQSLRIQLGNQGLNYVRQNYSWSIIERRYLDLFESFIK